MPDDIYVLGRAVIRSNGHVLVARRKGATNTFLPGGHVKQGERMHDAIARELREEVGEHSIIKDYLGAIEHSFDADGQMQHELNHLFEVVLPGMDGTSPPVSLESHLEFFWCRVDALESINIQPSPLVDFLKLTKAKAFWASTFRGGNSPTGIKVDV